MIRTRTLAATILATMLVTAHAVDGNTLQVELWGIDNLRCGSEANPCRTLGYTISQRATPGDRILLGPGEFREDALAEPTSNGTSVGEIRIESTLGQGATSIRFMAQPRLILKVLATDGAGGDAGQRFVIRWSSHTAIADLSVGSDAS